MYLGSAATRKLSIFVTVENIGEHVFDHGYRIGFGYVALRKLSHNWLVPFEARYEPLMRFLADLDRRHRALSPLFFVFIDDHDGVKRTTRRADFRPSLACNSVTIAVELRGISGLPFADRGCSRGARGRAIGVIDVLGQIAQLQWLALRWCRLDNW
jgi:hypothetical protein